MKQGLGDFFAFAYLGRCTEEVGVHCHLTSTNRKMAPKPVYISWQDVSIEKNLKKILTLEDQMYLIGIYCFVSIIWSHVISN